MNLLIVFPSVLECNRVESLLKLGTPTTNTLKITFLVSGIGIFQSTLSLQKHLLTNKVDGIIHAGIAGIYSKSTFFPKSYLVNRDIFADIGFYSENTFTSFLNTKLLSYSDIVVEENYIGLNHRLHIEHATSLTRNSCGNVVNDAIFDYWKTYSPILETMEGAAVMQTAKLFSIHCLQIRTVSNIVGERRKEKWKMDDALELLSSDINRIIPHYVDYISKLT